MPRQSARSRCRTDTLAMPHPMENKLPNRIARGDVRQRPQAAGTTQQRDGPGHDHQSHKHADEPPMLELVLLHQLEGPGPAAHDAARPTATTSTPRTVSIEALPIHACPQSDSRYVARAKTICRLVAEIGDQRHQGGGPAIGDQSLADDELRRRPNRETPPDGRYRAACPARPTGTAFFAASRAPSSVNPGIAL